MTFEDGEFYNTQIRAISKALHAIAERRELITTMAACGLMADGVMMILQEVAQRRATTIAKEKGGNDGLSNEKS
jgi:hypothetical protein